MPKCLLCRKSVRGSDKMKVKGVWQHHHSPVRKKNEIVRKFAWGLNPEGYTDEQLLHKVLEKRYMVESR